MRKLLQGVVDFHSRVRPGIKETFAKLALGQAPDALFIACSDSRVAANVFASTDPGDMFVVRNVGNLIPPCGKTGVSESDESEMAAIEFALLNLNVHDVVVCGHSECGAMQAVLRGSGGSSECCHLNAWLRHGKEALERLEKGEGDALGATTKHNRLSQLNVLVQLEHLLSYSIVRERVEAGTLRLHGWWFDIGGAEVSVYDETERRFVVIDGTTGPALLAKM